MSPEVAGPSWRYRSRGASARTEETERFRSRLSEALRIGHGLGVAFRIEFGSGSGGGIEFGAEDPLAGRWFGRVLVEAYPHPGWGLSVPSHAHERVVVRVGGPLRPWPHPLRSGFEGASWGDSIARGVGALPAGLRVVWSLRGSRSRRPPVPISAYRSPDLASYSSSLRSLGPPTATERRWRDRWEEQQQALLWAATTYIVGGPRVPSRREIDGVAALVESVTRSPGGNAIRFRSARWGAPRISPFVLTEQELVGLFPSLDGVERGSRACPVRSPPRVVLGRTGLGAPLDLEWTPREGRHVTVLGETGMGKSTLLIAIARQASTAHGVILLDPVGDTGRALLSALEPDARERAVWISPANAPIGLNALAGGETGAGEVDARGIADLVLALRRVRADRYSERSPFWGPRIEEMLTRVLLAAGSIPGGTLADALSLLEAPERQRSGGSAPTSSEWHALRIRSRERPEEMDGARRLLHEVVGNPVLAALLCARLPRWNASELLVPRRVSVVTGDAARIGEGPARQLLSIYLALIWSAILARPRPSKTVVILDEVQWFGNEALSEMLRLGRRFNVHLVLATQALGSLGEELRRTIGTNVADFVLFRGSPEDAREFGRIAPGVAPEELMTLGRGEALLLRGKGARFDRLRTPPGRVPGVDADVLREIARSTVARFAARGEERPNGGSSGIEAPAALSLAEPAMNALLERVVASSGPDPVRVYLDDLRRTEGPEAVRSLGAALGREGRIHRHGRDAEGAYWELRPEELRDRGRSPRSRECDSRVSVTDTII